MSTDFFQRQADAQRGTFWLICMFCLSVLAIVGIVMAIAAAVVQTQMREPNSSISAHPEQVVVPMIAGAVALLIILGGTAYKVLELKTGGGSRVAESLGGRRIYPNTTDRVERRLLNVVEEMALASGTPVPPVFMLNEAGINAFAAGYTPSDAVLGVTRGCAEQLSRDELQGVIAHEFSHVLNGDMRMSIRSDRNLAWHSADRSDRTVNPAHVFLLWLWSFTGQWQEWRRSDHHRHHGGGPGGSDPGFRGHFLR